MKIYNLPDGDKQFPDFKYRKSFDWLHLFWFVNLTCNLNCPYCVVGSRKREKGAATTLVDAYGVDRVVSSFKRLGENAGKNVYVSLSGGEPTLANEFTTLCTALTDAGMTIELQTNLVSPRVGDWLAENTTDGVVQIMATYHGYILDKNQKLYDTYVQNFHDAMQRGFAIICKIVVPPGDISTIEKRVEKLRNDLPEGAPILVWNYIKGGPKSPTEPNGAYPYAYTKEQEDVLKNLNEFRRAEQQAYRDGAGFFKGMSCGAGTDFVFLCRNGELYRCWPERRLYRKSCFGHIVKDNIHLKKKAQKCRINLCGTVFWPLWYGGAPWKYTPGWKKEQCYFCRYGPEGIDFE